MADHATSGEEIGWRQMRGNCRHLRCWPALVAAFASGCTALVDRDPAHKPIDGATDYPVQVVAAVSVPRVHIDVAVSQLNLWFGGHRQGTEPAPSGKVDGALQGAGRAVLECGFHTAPAGAYFPFFFAPCAALAVPVMATIGAYEAAPQADVDAVRQASTKYLLSAAHDPLVEKSRAYLAGVSGRRVETRQGPQAAAAAEVAGGGPDYPPKPDAMGTLLELGLTEIRLVGSGKMDEPLCLHMAAHGRKLDAATGKLLHELDHARSIACHAASEWLADDAVLFGAGMALGQRILAEWMVDQFYLVYRPAAYLPGAESKDRTVPRYVLAPRDPPAPAVYLDLRSVTGKAGHVQGWGGMHFADIDSLVPTLSWEGFPRAFDIAIGDYTDITYDLRLYEGEVVPAGVAEPAALLQEAIGLVEPRYPVATPLQPCSRYFWTVRARFTLNGSRRVTEWAGAYDTAGGEVSPSYQFYYPFRTASAGNGPDCWD